MARPREFNESEALGGAMLLFWQRGYENASLSDITQAMGLSKSSLYGTFGSKHELLLSSLQYYVENMIEPSLTVLEEEPSPRAAIAKRFEMVIEGITGPGPRCGCLIVNSTLELHLIALAVEFPADRAAQETRGPSHQHLGRGAHEPGPVSGPVGGAPSPR